LTINLLEGGSFLTEERIDDIDALRQKFQGSKAADVLLGRPVGIEANLRGYVMTLGFGSQTAASVFSPDHEYEVQVVLSPAGYARGIKDPFEFTSKMALEILCHLFGQRG
jgi:hypothetical protein